MLIQAEYLANGLPFVSVLQKSECEWIYLRYCCTYYVLVKNVADTGFFQDSLNCSLNYWRQKLANPATAWLCAPLPLVILYIKMVWRQCR